MGLLGKNGFKDFCNITLRLPFALGYLFVSFLNFVGTVMTFVNKNLSNKTMTQANIKLPTPQPTANYKNSLFRSPTYGVLKPVVNRFCYFCFFDLPRIQP